MSENIAKSFKGSGVLFYSYCRRIFHDLGLWSPWVTRDVIDWMRSHAHSSPHLVQLNNQPRKTARLMSTHQHLPGIPPPKSCHPPGGVYFEVHSKACDLTTMPCHIRLLSSNVDGSIYASIRHVIGFKRYIIRFSDWRLKTTFVIIIFIRVLMLPGLTARTHAPLSVFESSLFTSSLSLFKSVWSPWCRWNW